MRVFLVQTAQGLTPSSGGYKANISLLRQLRQLGHATAQICYGFEHEVEQSAKTAAEKGVEPKITQSDALRVKDSNGIKHELLVRTFNDEDGIKNVVISRQPYNLAYPTKVFWKDVNDYLTVSCLSISCPENADTK